MADNKSMASTHDGTKQPGLDIGAALFGISKNTEQTDTVNPFSTRSASTSTISRVASSQFSPLSNSATSTSKAAGKMDELPETFASKLKVSGSPKPPKPTRQHEPWPAQEALLQPYVKLYLDAEYEILSRPSTPDVSEAMARIETGEVSIGSDKGEDRQLFESTMDKTFQHFADRMSRNPEQVIRYEFAGTPVLYNSTDQAGEILAGLARYTSDRHISGISKSSRIPRCTICGADRVFEVQLTPHMITVLEEAEMSLDGMEWGTIIVAVCSKNCSPVGVAVGEVSYVEEWSGVQWEEQSKKQQGVA